MPRSADTPPAKPGTPAPERAGEDEGFLTRWSRRKRAGRDGQVDDRTPHPASTPEAGPVADTSPKEPPQLTDEDVPPVESLDEHSDYSAFLSPKVSEELRQAALRKLFQLPEFNVRDGLDDYDEDYTTFTELGDLVPHDMKRMFEREQKRIMAADAQPEPREATDPRSEPETNAKSDNPDPASLSSTSETQESPVNSSNGTGGESA